MLQKHTKEKDSHDDLHSYAKQSQNRCRGITLIEALIGIAIIVSAVIAAFFYYGIATKVAEQSTDRVQAAIILSETAEALRTMRDQDWSNISSLTEGENYNLYFSGTAWQATTTPQLLEGKFTRYFTIFSVSRDSNDDIVLSGGTNDPDTKRATINVEWVGSADYQTSGEIYLANIFE